MNTAERRGEILKILHNADAPVAARELAGKFGVSRQVIVQDLAVIRASTPGILSTTKGYVIQQDSSCSRDPWLFPAKRTALYQRIQAVASSGGNQPGTESDRRLWGACQKYQYQSQSLWSCQRGDGYSLQTGCE